MIKYVFKFEDKYYYMFVETREYDHFFKYAVVETSKINKECKRMMGLKWLNTSKYHAIDVITGRLITTEDNLERLHQKIYNIYREKIIDFRKDSEKMKKNIEIRDNAISIYEELNKMLSRELNDEWIEFVNMDLLNLKLERR